MDNRDKYEKAAEVHKEAMRIASENMKEGELFINIADDIEEYIREETDCGIAFPVNISPNGNAAHRTSSDDDESKVGKDDIISVDIGVHFNGYIIDGAKTFNISGNYDNLIESTNQSLEEALDVIEAGNEIRNIGEVVESKMEEYGYKPISNLNGHGLEQYELHANPTVYNKSGLRSGEFEAGQVIAVEPFGSTGSTKVRSVDNAQIYEVVGEANLRDRRARKLYEEIKDNYEEFPFAKRWLNSGSVDYSIRKLINRNVLKDHDVLGIEDGVVAQAEHTILVEEDGCEVLTKHEI